MRKRGKEELGRKIRDIGKMGGERMEFRETWKKEKRKEQREEGKSEGEIWIHLNIKKEKLKFKK